MNRFSASVEIGADGWATFWVPELPGLFLNGPTERKTLRELPQAIKAYQRWLRGHGEPVGMTAAPTVDVVQRSKARARMRWGQHHPGRVGHMLCSMPPPDYSVVELSRNSRILIHVRCRVDKPDDQKESSESRDASSLLASLKRKLPAEKFARFCELAPKDRKELWDMFVEYRNRHVGSSQYGYVEFADQILSQPKQ